MESIKEWRGSSFINNPFSLLNYAKGGRMARLTKESEEIRMGKRTTSYF
jgi:hypothetical protein